jgi:dTDP-4-dehydrorhamnose 3,5-epimerase
MKFTKCHLEGLLLIEPDRHSDERGFFLETFEKTRYRDHGVKESFVQENHSRSAKDVLRGLHFTKNKPQAQIVTVIRGRIFDVVVDIRKGSPTFGSWFGTELSEDGLSQLFMPHGFAHGFCVLSDWADLHYMVSQRYDQHDESGLLWNDESVGIVWPVSDPVISPRDRRHLKLAEI